MKLKISVRKVATSIGLAVCVLSGGLVSAAPAQANTWLPYEVDWFYSNETCAARGKSLVRSQPAAGIRSFHPQCKDDDHGAASSGKESSC